MENWETNFVWRGFSDFKEQYKGLKESDVQIKRRQSIYVRELE